MPYRHTLATIAPRLCQAQGGSTGRVVESQIVPPHPCGRTPCTAVRVPRRDARCR
jgi:hypothetical protein